MRLTTVRCRHGSLALGIALLLVPLAGWGQDNPAHNRATLKGIGSVEMVVEVIDPVAERDGLVRTHLQTEVESRLRQAGIPVGPNITGHLHVDVDTMKSNDGTSYGYNVEVAYVQQVLLARDPKTLYIVPTWETGGVGVIATSRLREVRQDVINYVDQFIKAYLEQNPKP